MAVSPSDLGIFTTSSNLGGAITGNDAAGSVVFDPFTGDETSAGITEYACIFVKNSSSQTALATKIYVNSETSHAGVNATIGLGSSAVNGTEQTIGTKTSSPSSVTFSEANGAGNALTIGDIPAGHHKALWIKFSVNAGTAAKDAYTVQLGITCDTTE